MTRGNYLAFENNVQLRRGGLLALPNKRRFLRAFWKSVKIIKLATVSVIISMYPILTAHSEKPLVAGTDLDPLISYDITYDRLFLPPAAKTLSINVTQSEYQKRVEVEERARLAQQARQKVVTTYKPKPRLIAVSGQELMTQAGIPASDWVYVDFIINHEAGWNGALTYNGAGSGAYGICQALPGSKMASAGPDWRTNPLTQLRWCNSYAISRYGSWYKAYAFWLSHHWW